MYPENCWYVAAHANEVTEELFSRTLLAVIFWRGADGECRRAEDRCPHRLVPLSTGKTVNGQVEFGLRFNTGGGCAFVPGQEITPKSVKVQYFRWRNAMR